MRMNRYPPFRPAVLPLLKTAEQRRPVPKSNWRWFLRQTGSEFRERQKSGRKRSDLLTLLALSRGSRAHSACNVHLNHDKTGKTSNSRTSAGLVNFRNCFSRVGNCENRSGVDCLMNDGRCDPTVRPWKGPPRANFFHGSTGVNPDSLSRSFSKHPARWRAVLCCALLVRNDRDAEVGVLSWTPSRQPGCSACHRNRS